MADFHPSPQPPKWPDKLLGWFCPDELLEEVQGDLHERFYLRVQRVGQAKARTLYLKEVLAYMHPAFFKEILIKINLCIPICYNTTCS